MTVNIAVGSQKTYKIKAATSASYLVFGEEVKIYGVDVESGVSPQPMSAEEAITGARNRAMASLSQASPSCEIGLGIENGLVEVAGNWYATTWIVAVDLSGSEGMASSLQRPVPVGITDLVAQGEELSHAVRDFYRNEPVSEYDGLIGILTQGVLNRIDVLRDGIVAALGPIANVQMFERKKTPDLG